MSAMRKTLTTRPDKSGSRTVWLLQRWSVFVVVVLLWEWVTTRTDSPFFPPPSKIAELTWENWFNGPVSQVFLSDLAVNNLLPSIGRMLLAWAIAAVLGVAIGIPLGRSRKASNYVDPVLAFARAIPPPTLVPIFLVIFGLGAPMQVATIIFGVIWPVLLNSVEGARSVSPTQEETAKAFGLPRRQWVFGIVLPVALPKVFAGLRVSLSIALILMVISEFIGSTDGIGYVLTQAQASYRYDEVWSIIVLLGALGYLLNTVFLAVQRRALANRPLATGSEG
jgi:ABC-type nitrate/sulfonate/bicarbonate transport system permease component